MKRIKAVLGKKWTYLLLLVALGWIFWLWILPYRYTAMALWGIAGTVGVYDLLARLGRKHPAPARRMRRLFTGCLCLILALMTVTGGLVLSGAGGAEDPACAYVVVLGAGVNGTQPSPSLEERLEAALAYLQTYPEAQCVVSGGQGGGENITEALCMYTWLWSSSRRKPAAAPRSWRWFPVSTTCTVPPAWPRRRGWNAWASPQRPTLWFCGYTMDSGRFLAFGISCCLADHNMEGEHDMDKQYASYAAQQAAALLGVDSPTGFTDRAAAWVLEAFQGLGFEARLTTKGGVLIDLGGQNVDDALLLEAHTDTLGAMVAEVKSSGRLRLTPLGGMNANNAEAENVRVYTRQGKVLEGTCQLCNASVHVNGDYSSAKRCFDTVEVVLDAKADSREETIALGVQVGDIVCFEPRTRITETGYIKSRFLDDKLSVGILLGLAKYLHDKGVTPERRVYVHVTVYEEVGHGGAASVPAGVTEAISVDMGCVGDGLTCTERQVSICAKDSGGPYSYQVVGKLIEAAKAEGADYAVDVYPHYGSDVEATLGAGCDIRHGLIGAGVYASHGYERSHVDGVYNTLKVLKGYLHI